MNKTIYDDIEISPVKGAKYRLLKSIKYKDVFIPKGYVTNGADIPRILWSFLPPNKPDYMPAVILHDFLCDKGEYCKADLYFDSCLTELGINYIERKILVLGVTLYHRIRYFNTYKG